MAGRSPMRMALTSRHEIPQRNTHDVSDTDEVAESWVCLTVLDPLIGVPGDLGLEVYLLLRQARCPAGVLDPNA